MKITGQQPPEFHGVKGGNSKENQKTSGLSEKNSGIAEPSTKTSNFVMDKIKNQILSEPEVREELVAELKAKIKSGEYKVDSKSLSSKMLVDSLREELA